jgi:hypothetical protein
VLWLRLSSIRLRLLGTTVRGVGRITGVLSPRIKISGCKLVRAGSVAAMAAVAILASGCSLVEMPSNQSLAGPPQTASPSPSAGHGHAGSALKGPALEAITAERRTAGARSYSVSIDQQIGGAEPVTVSGEVTVRRAPLRASEQLQIDATGRTLPLIAVVTSTTLYIRARPFVPNAPKPWVGIPLAGMSGLGPLLRSAQNTNPMTQARMFLASTHVTVAGHQVINGVPTTRYRGSFTPAQALRTAVRLSPSSVRPLLAQAASLLTGDVHFTIWVGPGTLIRKYHVVETVSGQKVTTTCTINWFNQPVHIAVPPASEVISPPGGGVIGP